MHFPTSRSQFERNHRVTIRKLVSDGRGARHRIAVERGQSFLERRKVIIRGGLHHNAVNINQVRHVSNDFIGSLTTSADGGFAVMKFLDAVLINTEACRPNSKQHCDKLARDAKGITVPLAELEKAGTKLRWVDDRICT